MSNKITTVDVLCEFIEVVVHNILYIKQLYPETIFTTKRKYGITVFQLIQPDINEYINHCLTAISFHARRNQLSKLLICFHTVDGLMEKYVLDILNISDINESDPFLVELEQSTRDFLLKLHSSQSYVEQLPDDASFSIRLQTTSYSKLEFNQEPAFEDFPWIELRDKENVGSEEVVPLCTVKTNFLKLQMFIERQSFS